jgi:CRISPR-associated protein Cmr5
MNNIMNLEQARAEFAWNKIQALGYDLEEYRKLVKAAPALLMSNGLMQTLAYYQSRKDENNDPAKKLVSHIREWLTKQDKVEPCNNFSELMKNLYEFKDPRHYMQATEEALEILRWIRQLADAAERS